MSEVLKVPENIPEIKADIEVYGGRHWQAFKVLRLVGFLPFEAWRLRKIPLNKPYMVGLIKERTQRLTDAVKAGMTEKDYTESILKEYGENHWRTPIRVYNDPMKMLKDAKRRYSKEGRDARLDITQ